MYKHYIKVDGNNNVISSFSDAFKEPDQDSILIIESTERHYNLDLFAYINGGINVYKYKYDKGNVVEKTFQEINNELNSIENKEIKIKRIRTHLLKMSELVNSVYTTEKYGHDKSINTKPKILNDALMDEWFLWNEKMNYILSDLDLNNVNYEDIYLENTDIFPTMPNLPGDMK